jgi:hypothetical protein
MFFFVQRDTNIVSTFSALRHSKTARVKRPEWTCDKLLLVWYECNRMFVITLTVMAFELVDIFLPIRNCNGVMVMMQKAAPVIALTPSFWYRRYMRTPIWATDTHTFITTPASGIQLLCRLYNMWSSIPEFH